MEIVINNNEFDIVENGVIIYTAKTEDEAQGFIIWKSRTDTDAGNPQECENC